MVAVVFMALLSGMMYYRLDHKDFNARTAINDRIGALYFIVISQIFSILSALELFIKQRGQFM